MSRFGCVIAFAIGVGVGLLAAFGISVYIENGGYKGDDDAVG